MLGHYQATQSSYRVSGPFGLPACLIWHNVTCTFTQVSLSDTQISQTAYLPFWAQRNLRSSLKSPHGYSDYSDRPPSILGTTRLQSLHSLESQITERACLHIRHHGTPSIIIHFTRSSLSLLGAIITAPPLAISHQTTCLSHT